MKKKLTLVDWILIILLCISVISVPLRLVQINGQKDLRELRVTVLSRNVHEQTVATLSVGDLLYNDAGELFGRIVSFEQRPIVRSVRDDGKITEESLDTYFLKDVCLELAILGDSHENVFLRDGKYPILSGMTVRLYTQKAMWSFLVLNTRELE